jgi:hypothetical protein
VLRLIAEVKDAELLFKMVHTLGTTFYKPIGNGEFEVVYFSGEKIVHFIGKLSEEQIKSLEHTGWKVSEIVVNEVEGEVKIRQ